MKTTKARIKLSLILTIPIFVLIFWITWLHAMSSNALLTAVSIWQLLVWGCLASFIIAYAITLYVSVICQKDERGTK